MNDGTLYAVLHPRAHEIVHKFFGRAYHAQFLKEAAHDITVDFIYFSTSLKEVYDPKRKTLKPFFSSYVRKKCMGLRQKQNIYNKIKFMSELDNDGENLFIDEDEHMEIVEMIGRFRLMRKVLRGKSYKLNTEQMKSLERAKRPLRSSINLDKLFVLNIISNIERGKTDYNYIALQLRITLKLAKFVMGKLREVMRREMKDGRA